ncbi:MAG: ABC transporter ATP-binding protein, partial [bacterium]
DVSFEAKQGDRIGIVGRNGAGKSTLLKILSRITEPTTGEAFINGRVGSLLEVGTGFHPELTGRENIFLSGTIQGMKKSEIIARFDEIVAFSEVEKFLDTPVKRYSSGMFVRLAFAVAAHLEPEILIVDEVLAVGDAAFQKKCLEKMEAVAGNNRSILFVSHNMHAVATLCHKVIWLENGQVRDIGPARQIIANYTTEALLKNKTHPHNTQLHDNPTVIERVRVMDTLNEERNYYDISEPITIEIQTQQQSLLSPLRYVLRIYSAEEDTLVLGTTSLHDPSLSCPLDAGHQAVQCRLPGNLLNIGTYWISVGIDRPNEPVYSEWQNATSFHLTQKATPDRERCRPMDGLLSPFQKWQQQSPAGKR